MIDKNCLSYWFPKLRDAGIPVPRTEIVITGCQLGRLLDGEIQEDYGFFVLSLKYVADQISKTGPWFLRTGMGSGKHNWSKTCYVTDLDKIGNHVAALVEWSAMADFAGLPCDVWAVREFLNLKKIAVCKRYGDMPLAREFRCFITGGALAGGGKIECVHPYWPRGALAREFRCFITGGALAGGGKIECVHPYWPREAVENGRPSPPIWEDSYKKMCDLGDDEKDVRALALDVADVFQDDGRWSVDLCQTTDDKWYVTDMAEAHRSWHWPECEKQRPCGRGQSI